MNPSVSIRIVALSLIHGFGCNEALPPRDEPPKALRLSLQIQPLPIRVQIDSARAGSPETIIGTNGSLQLSIRNNYSEVLQGTAQIRGTVKVWLANIPGVWTSVDVSEANMEYPIIKPDGILTIEPNDSVRVVKQWSHVANTGRDFWRYGPLTIEREPGTGITFFKSAPVRLLASASLQVFSNVQPEQSDLYECELIYHIYVFYGFHGSPL